MIPPDRPREILPVSVVEDLPPIEAFTIDLRLVDVQLSYEGDRIENEWVSASQSVTIVTDQTKDADGLREGSAGSSGGRASSPPLLGGMLGKQPSYQLIVDPPVRLGPHKVAVRFRTSTYRKSGFIRPTPDGLEWSLTVVIDGEGSQPTYNVTGDWSGAHAAELDVNGRQIYRYAATVPKPEPPPTPVYTPPTCLNPNCTDPNCKYHHCKDPAHTFHHCSNPNCNDPNCKDHNCKEPHCEDKSNFASRLVGDMLEGVLEGLFKGRPTSVTSGRIEINGPVRAPMYRL